MSDDFLRLNGEKQNLTLTIIDTDGDFLSVEDAKIFADELLTERGEQSKWTFDGSNRLNYNRVNVFYID